MRARRRPQGLVVHRVPAVKSRDTGLGARGVGVGSPVARLSQATAGGSAGRQLHPAAIQVTRLDSVTAGRYGLPISAGLIGIVLTAPWLRRLTPASSITRIPGLLRALMLTTVTVFTASAARSVRPVRTLRGIAVTSAVPSTDRPAAAIVPIPWLPAGWSPHPADRTSSAYSSRLRVSAGALAWAGWSP